MAGMYSSTHSALSLSAFSCQEALLHASAKVFGGETAVDSTDLIQGHVLTDQKDSSGQRSKVMSTRAEKGMAGGFNLELVLQDDVVLPKFFCHRLEALKSRKLRDGDILLCTYPKSGTHWLWEILNMITAGKAEYAQHWKNIGVLEYHTESDMESIPSPRILSTHLPPQFLPIDILKKKCCVVHCERNPKDAMVSFFVQHSNHNRDNRAGAPAFGGTWGDYFDVNMNRSGPYGLILDHVQKWNTFHEVHSDLPYLQLHYEDLKTDDVKEIRRIAEFVNRTLPENVYRQIAEACHFDKLKHVSENVKDQKYHNRWKEGSSGYFRKGVIGDWKNWFTVAQSERFDEEYERMFHQKFPY